MNLTAVIAFFFICLCVIIPFLYWYAKRNPDPRFRPRFGELVLVGIMLFGAASGASFFMGTMMGVDFDLDKIEQDMKNMGRPAGGGPDKDKELFGGDKNPFGGGSGSGSGSGSGGLFNR